MSATTLIAPSPEELLEQNQDPGHLVPGDENADASGTPPVRSDAELEKMSAVRLKATITSEWKRHERLAKNDMAPLLYWLREKLRAPGSRNDIHDKDRGFGAWVAANLPISRATVDRWADEYGEKIRLITPDLTSPHVRRGCKNPEFYRRKLAKRGKGIKLFVKEPLRDQYWDALNSIKKHFNIADNGEAVVKGLCYAVEAIESRDGNRIRHTTSVRRRKS